MNTRLASALSRATAAIVAVVLATILVLPSHGSQNSCIMPNAGTVSGLTLVNDITACNNSLLTLYSGASAPSSPSTGMFWYNTTTNYIQQYDGAGWLNIWYVDAASHLATPLIGGGVVSAALTAAATTDIGSVPQPFVTINGATPITSLGTSASVGSIHVIKFGSSLPLAPASNLILPSNGNTITTQAGDIAVAIALGGGNWQVLIYSPATGNATVNTSFPLGTVLFGDYANVPAKFMYGYGQALTRTSYPAYTAAVARAQSGTLTSGNATIAAIGNTQGFGVGMPVEGPGINIGCTIASIVANTSVALNSSSCVTANGSASVSVFLTGYGSGGSGSTVGVKDCRGRVLAGRDDLGGAAAGRLTTAGFGTGATSNNSSGSSLETYTMALGNLISHTHANTLSDPGHAHGVSGGIYGSPSGGSEGLVGQAGGGYPFQSVVINSATTGITINNAAAGSASPTPMRTVQPTIISDCIVAVLP